MLNFIRDVAKSSFNSFLAFDDLTITKMKTDQTTSTMSSTTSTPTNTQSTSLSTVKISSHSKTTTLDLSKPNRTNTMPHWVIGFIVFLAVVAFLSILIILQRAKIWTNLKTKLKIFLFKRIKHDENKISYVKDPL